MAKAANSSTFNFKSIDPDLARDMFNYRPESGELVWRARPGEAMRSRNTRFAGKVAGHIHTCTVGKRYVQVRVDNIMHYAHRIVWVLHNGPIPPGMQIDHIDGDGTNNRISNLRMVTASQNKRNMRRLRTNSSGRTGVHRAKSGAFYAKGWKNGRPVHLGWFWTFTEASAARSAWEWRERYHGNHGTARAL